MKPLPTPYDIIPPPSFAFVPPTSAWIIPILIVAASIALVIYLRYSDRSLFFRIKRKRILQSYFRDLDEIATSYPPTEAAALASALTRRFLSSIIREQDFSSMTSSEMHRFFTSYDNKNILTLIEVLLPFEEQRYRRQPSISAIHFLNELRKTAFTLGEGLLK